MRITLVGYLSLRLEDEWLFDGRSVYSELEAEVPEASVTFEGGKAHLTVDVPLDLKISEQEWSRAVGELLARGVRRASA